MIDRQAAAMHIAMQNRLIRVVQLAQIVAQRALLCQTQQMSRVFSKPFRFRSITRCSVPYAFALCAR